MKRMFLHAIVCFVFSACVAGPQVNWSDPTAISTHVTVEHDDFKKLTRYEGPSCHQEIGDRVFLRAWKNDILGTTSYQIYVLDHYWGDWHFYDHAYDVDGNKMDLVKIAREVGSCTRYACSFDEHVALNVTREYLETHVYRGIKFQVSGRGGDAVFFVPGTYVQAFLNITK